MQIFNYFSRAILLGIMTVGCFSAAINSSAPSKKPELPGATRPVASLSTYLPAPLVRLIVDYCEVHKIKVSLTRNYLGHSGDLSDSGSRRTNPLNFVLRPARHIKPEKVDQKWGGLIFAVRGASRDGDDRYYSFQIKDDGSLRPLSEVIGSNQDVLVYALYDWHPDPYRFAVGSVQRVKQGQVRDKETSMCCTLQRFDARGNNITKKEDFPSTDSIYVEIWEGDDDKVHKALLDEIAITDMLAADRRQIAAKSLSTSSTSSSSSLSSVSVGNCGDDEEMQRAIALSLGAPIEIEGAADMRAMASAAPVSLYVSSTSSSSSSSSSSSGSSSSR